MKLPWRFRNGSLSPDLYIDLHGLFGAASVHCVAVRSLSPKHEWHQASTNWRLGHRPHISGCEKRLGRTWFPWRWLNQIFHIQRLSQPTENLCCAIWKGSCKAATSFIKTWPMQAYSRDSPVFLSQVFTEEISYSISSALSCRICFLFLTFLSRQSNSSSCPKVPVDTLLSHKLLNGAPSNRPDWIGRPQTIPLKCIMCGAGALLPYSSTSSTNIRQALQYKRSLLISRYCRCKCSCSCPCWPGPFAHTARLTSQTWAAPASSARSLSTGACYPGMCLLPYPTGYLGQHCNEELGTWNQSRGVGQDFLWCLCERRCNCSSWI